MKRTRTAEYGKDTTPNPAVSKYAGLAGGGSAGVVSWEEVDGRLLKAAVCATTEDGCAIILSKTSDGGALSITLLAGPERVKKYAKDAQLAESILQELVSVSKA